MFSKLIHINWVKLFSFRSILKIFEETKLVAQVAFVEQHLPSPQGDIVVGSVFHQTHFNI